jgi:hypothetical protein
MLMPNDDDLNSGIEAAVNDGVWKDSKGKDPAALGCGCAEAWMLDKKLGDALELDHKAPNYKLTCMFSVEAQRVSNILFRARVQ